MGWQDLILFDEAGGIRQLAIWDPTGALTAETLQVRPGGLSRQVLTTGQRVLLPDLAEEPPGRVNPALRQAGRSAAICVPLPGHPGVLWFHYATPHPFSQAELRVTDTGIGIKKEDLPKLFQPFTQLEPVYSKQYQGTGLGLALTKRLVELHGGEIRAESEGEGRGSTFTVRLPLVPPGGAVPAGRQEGGEHALGDDPGGGG